MPAAVIIGAQWGDEAREGHRPPRVPHRLRRQVQRREQRRPHGRRRRREVRAPPAALRHPHARRHPDHRQRRRRRPRGPVPGARRTPCARCRHIEAARVRERARHHALPPHHRQGDRAVPRQAPDRHHRRGIGPTYADKINRVGIRIQDIFDENILRQKVEAALDQKNHLLVKVFNRGRSTRTRSSSRCCPSPTGSARWSRTRPSRSTAHSSVATPCCSRPVRRPCSTSTTAPTRS